MGQHFSSENLSLSDKTSVLLVEEAPGDAHRFEKFLRKSSWEAILRRVQGLDEGLTALREDPPDVVIVDLNLPDEDGTTAIEHCAAAAPQVPIVALTSSDAMPSARSIEEAGAAEYLRKDRLTPALIGKTLRWVQKQRQMQDTIRRQDAWFRSMTDNVSEGVFRAGPTARIEYANEAFAALFGYDRGEEMQGIDFTTLYANPEQRGRMMAGEGAERAELSFRRPDGTTFTGLLNATAARDPNGKIQHFDGVLVDIDERKERERKLRVLSGAVQKAQEAVLVTEAAPLDEPGPQIVYANEAFEEMTGYAEEEILGETARVLQGPETDRAVLDSLRAALEAGDPWEGETVNYRKDGTPFYVQWNVAPVRNENGDIEHWVSIQRDVTEERNREERLRRQKSLLEQAQRLAGAWEVDLGAEEMSWSDKIYEIHELDPSAELTAAESFQFYAPEARPKVREAFERCAEEGEPYDLELPIVTAEGNRRWVRTVGAPAETEEGEVTKVAGAFQDITERKEAERKLRRSRERYRSLFRDSNDAILVHDLEGRTQEANPQAESLFGREAGALEGQSVRTLHAPEEQDTAQEKLAALRAGEFYQAVSRYERADGSVFWGEVSANATEIGDETVVRTLIRDVTEREESRRKLERYREYTDRLLDAIDDLFFALDEEGQLQRWNDSVPETTGYAGEEIGEMEAFDLVPEEERERVAEEITEALVTGSGQIEVPLLRRDGTTVPYEFAGNLVEHPNGDLQVVGIGRDITERKEAEQQLRRREARLRGLAHSIPGVTYRFLARPNGTHQFQFVGEHAEDLLGISSQPDGFFERLLRQVPAGHQERLLIQIEEAVEQEESWSLELPFEKPSGERLWLYSAATPERVGGELTFSGVLLDTTKRRQLERKVIAISDEEQRRIGENLHDVLASKLAGTSMVARSAATSLEKGNDLSADHLHEVADQIEEASRHARSLSQSLTPLEIQNGGLTEGLRNLVDRQESISGISCSFETEGHAELSEDVAAHLYRMGAEAMHNALRHADPNRVEIRLQFEEDHLVLSVKDDGKGILKETDSSDAHGLQLMQYRSDLIGAHLDIGPLEEGGTLVRCSLPMDQASQAFV